jgi:hypothetical protein
MCSQFAEAHFLVFLFQILQAQAVYNDPAMEYARDNFSKTEFAEGAV